MNPERIIACVTGIWSSGVLAAACTHQLFARLRDGCATAEALAERAQISPRGAQALLDGLVAAGLVVKDEHGYHNSDEAIEYLLPEATIYLGDWARWVIADAGRWTEFPEAARTGAPVPFPYSTAMPRPEGILAIGALGGPVAREAAGALGIANAGPIRFLDVGGGAGIYSSVWLSLNPDAHAVQVDRPNMNAIARAFVDSPRFSTIDGDFHRLDLGEDLYEVAVLSHVAHGEAPDANVALLTKVHRALKQGGTLLIADFILDDERRGPPLALMLHAEMLRNTPTGAPYRASDFQAWLARAGFGAVRMTPASSMGVSLIYAR